jgi:hypothetical protein
MDQHTLLAHTIVRRSMIYSPTTAGRREELFWLEAEAREARRRRGRALIRGAWNALNAFRRSVTGDQVRIEAPDAGRGLS